MISTHEEAESKVNSDRADALTRANTKVKSKEREQDTTIDGLSTKHSESRTIDNCIHSLPSLHFLVHVLYTHIYMATKVFLPPLLGSADALSRSIRTAPYLTQNFVSTGHGLAPMRDAPDVVPVTGPEVLSRHVEPAVPPENTAQPLPQTQREATPSGDAGPRANDIGVSSPVRQTNGLEQLPANTADTNSSITKPEEVLASPIVPVQEPLLTASGPNDSQVDTVCESKNPVEATQTLETEPTSHAENVEEAPSAPHLVVSTPIVNGASSPKGKLVAWPSATLFQDNYCISCGDPSLYAYMSNYIYLSSYALFCDEGSKAQVQEIICPCPVANPPEVSKVEGLAARLVLTAPR